MLKPAVTKTDNAESRFLHLYKIVQEREKYLSKEALVVQYSALLRYFMKFYNKRKSIRPMLQLFCIGHIQNLAIFIMKTLYKIRIIVNTFWQQNIITSLWLMRAVRKKKPRAFSPERHLLLSQ